MNRNKNIVYLRIAVTISADGRQLRQKLGI